jgi:plasmid stabilization system protein ParE
LVLPVSSNRQGMTQCFELLADTPRLGRKVDQYSPGARRYKYARHVIIYRSTAGRRADYRHRSRAQHPHIARPDRLKKRLGREVVFP